MTHDPLDRPPPAPTAGVDPVVPGTPAGDRAGELPSNWAELRESIPDIARLLRDLMLDARVPWHAKALSAAAVGYAVLPLGHLPGSTRGSRFGVDDLAAGLFAVRHLIAAAGYDVVRERWTGTDAAFGLLVVLAGVDR
jgi:uncharacterized membrane protein YkvA (DUF1232 family)